jgi:hypothetical protein
VGAENHDATRTTVTFVSTNVGELAPGEAWFDEAGIFHERGLVLQEEASGDIAGTVIATLNTDAVPIGDECTEESCPGDFITWGHVEITSEDGGWEGTYTSYESSIPGDEFFEDRLVLKGTGANARKSIVAQAVDGDESSITFEGVMSTLATPIVGLNISIRLCADPTDFSFAGGYTSSGAIDGASAAFGEFLVTNGPWTHTYAVSGTFTLTDEHGSVTIAFGADAQDTANPLLFASHVWGHFVIVDGSGAYADLYGSGRIIGGALEGSSCASGFGVNAALVGEAHYND